MPGSAWRFVAVLLLASGGWMAFTPRTAAQLRITPPVEPTSTPVHGITVRPVPGDEPAATPAPDTDILETLKQQLKETQDRLHAYEADYEALTRRNELKTTTIQGLNESLARANAEREVLSRGYTDLNNRMEAFGLASVGDNKQGLEERLLQAVNDLRLAQIERDKLRDSVMGLTESVLLFMKTATTADPQIRLQVEAQIRAANEAADKAAAQDAPGAKLVEGNLNDGAVISVEEKLSLVIFNRGTLQGVKVGTPFQIVRGNKFVARGRVVEVRERISGLVVEDYSSNTEKVKVGDTMRVEVQPVQS